MPAVALPALTPYLITAGIGWVMYRRIRRSFGRQPWQPKRTMFRLALMVLLLGMLMMAAIFLPGVAIGIAAGLAGGLLLGGFALRHTRVEWHDGHPTYVPNPWFGGLLTLLLVGRLAWRWSHGAFADGAAATAQQASPLTMAFAGALVGYFLLLNGGLLWRMRQLHAAAG
ncbi:hypothetical protein [Pseudoxanthomonas beigongshangi]